MNMSKERFFTLIRIFTVIELLLLLSSCGWSFPETQREPDYNYSQRQDGDPEPVELKQESNVGHGSVSRIIKKVSPSVVGISTAHLKRDSLWDDTRLVEGIGSGVIVHSTGYILTNDHVVGSNPDNISVILQNGDELEGRTLWSDPTLDLAIIKVDAVNLPAAVLETVSSLKLGIWLLLSVLPWRCSLNIPSPQGL